MQALRDFRAVAMRVLNEDVRGVRAGHAQLGICFGSRGLSPIPQRNPAGIEFTLAEFANNP